MATILAGCTALVLVTLGPWHGLGIEVKLQGERLVVEVFFDDDTPASEAKVALTSRAGATLQESVCDEKGVWSIPLPAPGEYTVHADAGGGHRARRNFTLPAPAADPRNSAPVLSPSRAEQTGFAKLYGVLLGLLVLAIGAITAKWFLRRNKPA